MRLEARARAQMQAFAVQAEAQEQAASSAPMFAFLLQKAAEEPQHASVQELELVKQESVQALAVAAERWELVAQPLFAAAGAAAEIATAHQCSDLQFDIQTQAALHKPYGAQPQPHHLFQCAAPY